MKKLAKAILILMSVVVVAAGCSAPNESDGNIETIKTFIKKEFTGPNDELTTAFHQDGAFPPELKKFVEENYSPLVKDWEDMMNLNHILFYQRMAHENGYQMKPTSIEINKDQDLAYDYKVDLEYSKNGETNEASIAARVNVNEDGKIVSIRNMDVDGLMEKLKQ